MRQVVTENWTGESVKIELSYDVDKDLVGKKEYQEVSRKTQNGKIVKYWVNVADDAVGVSENVVKPSKKNFKRLEEKAEKTKLWSTRQANAEKYRKMVEAGNTLFGCDQDNCFDPYNLPELKVDLKDALSQLAKMVG